MDRDPVVCVCRRCAGSLKEPGDIAGSPCLLCKGKGTIPDCQLSPHFRYSELVHTSKHGRNDPEIGLMDRIQELCREGLERIRATPLPPERCEKLDLPANTPIGPLIVTSGYRTQELDMLADAGNKRWLHEFSGHSWGAAADIVPARSGLTIVDLVEAGRLLPTWDQLILEGGCCHVGFRCPVTNAQRRQVFIRLANPLRDPSHPKFNPDAPAFVYDNYRPGDVVQHAACV